MTHRLRGGGMLAVVLLLALVTSACSGSSSASTQTASGSPAGTTFSVTLTEFTITPSQIQAPAGQTLVFEVKNGGTTAHTFAVQTSSKVYATQQINPGSTATLRVDALDAGTYKTLCTIPGHADLGMVGQLVVGGSAGAGTDTSGSMAGMDMSGGTGMASMSVQQMLDGHKASIEAFPAKTQGTGNQPLKPVVATLFPLTITSARPKGPSFNSTSMPNASRSRAATRAAWMPESQ